MIGTPGSSTQASETTGHWALGTRHSRLAVILLAAGQGTRLRSRVPKPLHRVAGRPLVEHVLRAAAVLEPAETVVVTGHGAALVREHLALDQASIPGEHGRLVEAHQAEQLGTAHATAIGLAAVSDAVETVVVLYADTPLITGATLTALVVARAASGAPLALVTCRAPDPTGYGRILRDEAGQLTAIVEEKDASPVERAITEINAGIYAFDAAWLRTQLPRVERSPAGEYYLPDLVALAITAARPDTAWPVPTVPASLDEALGINDRVQLAAAEAVLRRRILHRLMLGGVTIIDPATTSIDDTVTIGQDTTIYPGTTITGPTTIGADCRIGPQAIIDSSVIADGCRVVASMLEQSRVETGVDIGPYSHLRPGAVIGRDVHIGNFAEIKDSHIGAETKIGHVSYIGDASVGERVNIGAGTITCNYDGVRKHRTVIGDDAFVGSDTMLVAPVEVGARGRTGASAVVTRDVPPDTLVVGVPARPRPGREE